MQIYIAFECNYILLERNISKTVESQQKQSYVDKNVLLISKKICNLANAYARVNIIT